MKYRTSDQIEHECEGPYGFVMTETDDGQFRDKSLELSMEVLPNHRSDYYAFAMAVVASAPPFLRNEDCPWILAYLHEFRSFHESQKPSLAGSGERNLLRQYSQDNDAVSLMRLMFSLDIASDIIHGGVVIAHDYFPSSDDVNIYNERFYLNFLGDGDDGYRGLRAPNVDYNKDFKRVMTQRVFSGVEVDIVIPDDEELVTSLQGQNEIFGVRAFSAQIMRFYKSELFWSNRGFLEIYPRFKQTPRQRLDNEPIVPVALPPIVEHGFYGSVVAYIPLHWISSVTFNGELRCASASFVPGVMRTYGRC